MEGSAVAGILHYDGGEYGLDARAAADLVDRGAIVRSVVPGRYSLAPEHVIEEVEPFATVLIRLTGSVARSRGIDLRSIAVGFHAPNGFGGRR